MFQFRRFPTYTYLIQYTLPCGGFPHSEISGSQLICSSPKLIAAYHVLHRLLMPRHSPCALLRLTSRSNFSELVQFLGSLEVWIMQAPSLDQFTLSNKIVIYPKISLNYSLNFLTVAFSSYTFRCITIIASFSVFSFQDTNWASKSSLKSSGSSSISLPKKGISNANAQRLPGGLQEMYPQN